VADDDNAAGEQDDMAAMMGFSGFGTSKKWFQIKTIN
jgi:hypothetical protein